MITLPHAWFFVGFYLIVPETLFSGQMLTDTEFWGWIYTGILISFWRYLSVTSSLAERIQKFLQERFGWRRRFLQWHALSHLILIWEIIVALVKFRKLIDDLIVESGKTHPKTPSHMQVPMWLLKMIELSPWACVATILVISYHIRSLAKLADDYLVCDQFSRFCDLDLVLICVMLPSWFSLMSLYGLARIWEGIFTPDLSPQQCLLIFRMDISLSVFLELLTVLAFAQLVMSPVRKWRQGVHIEVLCWSKPDVLWLAMNGVYYCVLAGAVQCFLQVVASVCLHLITKELRNDQIPDHCNQLGRNDGWKDWLYCTISNYNWNIDELGTMGILFCAYNMYFACALEEVRMYLPRANVKFHGTRAIILIAQVQAKVLLPESRLTQDYNKMHHPPLDGWCCALLHMALMQFEVLVIALFHWKLWKGHLNRRKDELSKSAPTPRPFRGHSFFAFDPAEEPEDDYDRVESPSWFTLSNAPSRLPSRSGKSIETLELQPNIQYQTSVRLPSTDMFGEVSDRKSPGKSSDLVTWADVEEQLLYESTQHGEEAEDSPPQKTPRVRKGSLLRKSSLLRAMRCSKKRRQRRQLAHKDYPWRLSGCLLVSMLLLLVHAAAG